MRDLLFVLVAVVSIMQASVRAQDAPDLDALLHRLSSYLTEYEAELSTVVAEEVYEQYEIGGPRPRVMPDGSAMRGNRSAMQRVLKSDIAFLRLPGDAEWFGVRDVKTVDGKAVKPSEAGRLHDFIVRAGGSRVTEAAAIIAASAEHNLGSLRTINMPTVPLELLRPANHVRFEFTLRGFDAIRGVKTRRIDFNEFDEPTLITGAKGEPLFSLGSLWIEPENGRLWRVEVVVAPPSKDLRARQLFQTKMRVEFMLDPTLHFLVPKELTEEFYSRGGRAQGRARYSSFRRFSTSARIVPE